MNYLNKNFNIIKRKVVRLMKTFQRVVYIVVVFIFILGFSTSCKKNNNKSGVTFKNVSIISDEIVGEAYYCEVPNAQKSISFTEYIEVEKKFSL